MTEQEGRYGRRQRLGFVAGPTLFVVVRLLVTPAGLSTTANAVLASTLWIAVWWMTEAVPIPVTSLLPVVLFPTLGVASVVETTAPYADPVVFLFLGGFAVALAIQRWNLHRRIALLVLLRAGEDARSLVLAFMVATAFLSMWVSNTATAMMMLPIGVAVAGRVERLRADESTAPPEPARDGPRVDTTDAVPTVGTLDAGEVPRSNFGAALLLGIAYAASIGGVATLIGTPPNAILAGIVRSSLDVELGFARWMSFGLPLAAVFLVVAWVVLLRVLPPEFRTLPGGRRILQDELAALGPMSTGERRVVAVFAFVVVGWLTRPYLIEPYLPGVTDTVVAVAGGVLVFLIPVDLRRGEFLLDWEATTRIPWGVLLLFGAGFSLANAFQVSGLDRWLADSLTLLQGADLVVVLLVLATLVVFLTEVTSNSATASLFVPVMPALAASLVVPPLVLMVTVATAASFAFMLPVATPPNAIVFGSGYVTIPQMARVGFWLNLLGVLLLTVASLLWLPVVWNL